MARLTRIAPHPAKQPLAPADPLQWWNERSAELQHQAGLTQGRAELKAFCELGDIMRAATTPIGRGPRHCAWCHEKCEKPIQVRPGLAGCVCCNRDCWSKFLVARRSRIDAALVNLGCVPRTDQGDIEHIDAELAALEPAVP
jgi:hypothetical protein